MFVHLAGGWMSYYHFYDLACGKRNKKGKGIKSIVFTLLLIHNRNILHFFSFFLLGDFQSVYQFLHSQWTRSSGLHLLSRCFYWGSQHGTVRPSRKLDPDHSSATSWWWSDQGWGRRFRLAPPPLSSGKKITTESAAWKWKGNQTRRKKNTESKQDGSGRVVFFFWFIFYRTERDVHFLFSLIGSASNTKSNLVCALNSFWKHKTQPV